MSVQLLRPPVADLVFQLYERPLHPEFFEILASRRITREDYELSVKITRTGHVICWCNPSLSLTEVTATAGLDLPPARRLISYRMRGEHSHLLSLQHNISYQMSFQVEVLPPEVFCHVHEEILQDGLRRGLLHSFQPHHRLALSPLGFVTAEARPGCLILSAFHTFPDESTVIKSQSLIERRFHS